MAKKYFVNPLGVVFHPELDKENNYTTIVCDPKTEKIIKTNSFGYAILKVIDENPGVSLENILALVATKHDQIEWQNKAKTKDFVKQMINENIVFER